MVTISSRDVCAMDRLGFRGDDLIGFVWLHSSLSASSAWWRQIDESVRGADGEVDGETAMDFTLHSAHKRAVGG